MKQAIANPNSSNVTRALKTASLGSAMQKHLQHRTLRCWQPKKEQEALLGPHSPIHTIAPLPLGHQLRQQGQRCFDILRRDRSLK